LCYTGLVKIMEWAVYFRKYDRYDKISFTFIRFLYILYYTGYFTSDNEPDRIENATHNTFATLTRIF
jgi:hypothetical protein